MARKVALNAAQALKARKKMTSHNTKVVVDENGNAHMYLFGNRIAVYTKDNRLFITNAGWDTMTTRNRLSELTSTRITRRGGLNGVEWDGRWVEIVEAGPVTMITKNEPPND